MPIKNRAIIDRWISQDSAARAIVRAMYEEKKVFSGLVFSTVATALTEGIGISMLVPLLAAINAGAATFSSIPFFGSVAASFSGLPISLRLEVIAVGLAFLSIGRGLMSYLTVVCAELMSLRVDLKTRRRVVHRILELNFEDAQALGTPAMVNYVMNFSLQVGQVAYMLALLLTNCVMLALYAVLCLLLSWQLTVVAGIMLIGAVQFIKIPLAHRVQASSTLRDERIMALWHSLLSGIRGLKLLRLFRAQGEQELKIGEAIWRFSQAETKGIYLRSLVDPAFQIAVAVIVSLLLLLNTLAFGDAIAERIPSIILFLFVLSRMTSPVQTINRARIAISSQINGANIALNFLRAENSPGESDGRIPISKLVKYLAFQNVSFGYRNSESPIIKNVSFDIRLSGITALVGPSGAGKTTIVGLLAGLFTPQSGRIVVDGNALADLKLDDWRSRVSFVTQDTVILDDTVRRNLQIGRPESSLAQMEEAARQAHALDFIRALPNGFDTLIGEKGIQLSGGQAQRLALARALLADPDLLVLDEATSNLDAESEDIIKRMLAILAGSRTIFVVAHRLSTVMRADQIVVLEDGKVVEIGNHADLMTAGGLYHRLVSLQTFVSDEDAGLATK